MKDVFIVNPKSGKNDQYELMKEIKEHFQGKRIIIEKTKGPGHATFIAQKYAQKEEPVHLFVCGGDGTLHEVINGCAQKDNIIVSVIPIGTGNDFVKYFEDYKREDFLNLANYTNPEYMDCDLLRVNGEYAINTISFGFDVEVAKQVNQLKKHFRTQGILPYALSALVSLRKNIGKEYQIQIDTKKLPQEKYSLIVFANGKYYGGGFKPCPLANISDGWMDVCLVSDVKRYQIVQLAKKYQEGTHIGYKDLVSMYQAKTVHLNTENEPIYANLDGEVKAFKNPTIEIIESAVCLALPRISRV